MLAAPDVTNLIAHKFASLRGGRLAFARIFAGTIDCFLFWHAVRLQKVRILFCEEFGTH